MEIPPIPDVSKAPSDEAASFHGMQVDCCIVGGGPCGLMAGLLLARAGISVVVLEKHSDFSKDFRGAFATRLTIGLQLMVQERLLAGALHPNRERIPWPVRLLNASAQLRRVLARVIGFGLRPEHIPACARPIEQRSSFDVKGSRR